MVAVSISDLAYLATALDSIAEQKQMAEYQFERLYRTAYNLTLTKETGTIDLLIKTMASKLALFDDGAYTHASEMVRDIFLFFNNTICKTRKTSVSATLDAARRRAGNTVPETPAKKEPQPSHSERRTSKRIRGIECRSPA
jgi:hypothetical protein